MAGDSRAEGIDGKNNDFGVMLSLTDFCEKWPLPVVHPWFETPNPVEGWMGERLGPARASPASYSEVGHGLCTVPLGHTCQLPQVTLGRALEKTVGLKDNGHS
jgi:hypothetical protein